MINHAEIQEKWVEKRVQILLFQLPNYTITEERVRLASNILSIVNGCLFQQNELNVGKKGKIAAFFDINATRSGSSPRQIQNC